MFKANIWAPCAQNFVFQFLGLLATVNSDLLSPQSNKTISLCLGPMPIQCSKLESGFGDKDKYGVYLEGFKGHRPSFSLLHCCSPIPLNSLSAALLNPTFIIVTDLKVVRFKLLHHTQTWKPNLYILFSVPW